MSTVQGCSKLHIAGGVRCAATPVPCIVPLFDHKAFLLPFQENVVQKTNGPSREDSQQLQTRFCVSVCVKGVYPAQVCGIMDESETVKRLRLAVHPDFTFRAGQW
ncbi:unnamed protein product [Oncorhynchus mykiss]|uniref:Uncharacterized protein n=1 Tax=Oncorhynchus mykiss TaxID=8022 RepID=A0A060XAP4_ONCMY|nr:unnamed protein product [Oncorhynchus mykiss]